MDTLIVRIKTSSLYSMWRVSDTHIFAFAKPVSCVVIAEMICLI